MQGFTGIARGQESEFQNYQLKLCITVDSACIDSSWAATHGENPLSKNSRNGYANSRKNQT